MLIDRGEARLARSAQDLWRELGGGPTPASGAEEGGVATAH
jgi:hypothetical protein